MYIYIYIYIYYSSIILHVATLPESAPPPAGPRYFAATCPAVAVMIK